MSLWPVAGLLAAHGLGVGLILAALHNAAMKAVPEQLAGTGAGVYSLFRFLCAAVGTALTGVWLQAGLDAGLTSAAAYRQALWIVALFPALGLLGALRLGRPAPTT